MDLKRFFGELIDEDHVALTGDEFYHAVKVTRHKIGYKLIVCTDAEYDNFCTVTEITNEKLIAIIDQKEKNFAESNYNTTLFIGNNKDLDTIVQKAVELGVNRIIPFTSQHGTERVVNYERLNKIIIESSKQCGRARLAVLEPQISFFDSINIALSGNAFLFYEYEKDKMVKNSLLDPNKPIFVFIGPEGGFSQEEILYAKEREIPTYTLGKRIMRVSTAVVAACTLVNERQNEV